MLPIDATTLRGMLRRESGMRAARQDEIIAGMGGPLAATLDGYEINTPLRIAHFLAQVAHESDDFCTTEEYASGNAYEGRKDLGNVQPGDGPLFKGRGLIQLTGRANYRSVGEVLGLDLVGRPTSVGDPFVYLLVSCEFWKQKKINSLCDEDNIFAVTQAVNGGQIGIDDRRAYLLKAKALVAALLAAGAAPPAQGMPVLHLGLTGDAVVALQKRLAAAGYPVAVEGNFGAATELAVKMFQAAVGLNADGVVGAATWGKLLQQNPPGGST